MTDRDPTRHRVDNACDGFEQCWIEGESPRIEEFLGKTTRAERAGLVKELLLLELDYRRRRGGNAFASRIRKALPGDLRTTRFDLRTIRS